MLTDRRARLPVVLTAFVALAGFTFAGGAFAARESPATTKAVTSSSVARPAQSAAAAARTTGKVTAVDGTTLTVTATDGSTSKVVLADGTTITATNKGTAADVRPGDTITITSAATAANGTLTASTVAVTSAG